MPTALTLIDLIAPALATDGISTGSTVLDSIGILPIRSWSASDGPTGSIIRGVIGLDDFNLVYQPPLSLSAQARIGGPAATRPRDQWFDIRDSAIEFLLHIPRAPSAMLDAAGIDQALLTALDPTLTDAPPSDAPGTAFTLDLLLTAVVLRPPGLVPAMLDKDGALVRDPAFTEVRITAPKLKMRLSMTDAPPPGGGGTPLDIALVSAGAAGLDDPGDLAVAELLSMEPPLALWGEKGPLGFGFRSATLDLSSGSTPPAILEKFGCDDDWRGIYLPEARLYVAPGGTTGLAFTGFVTDLLLSFEGQLVLSADATVQVVERGDGALKVGARFVAAARPAPYAITYLDSNQTQASVALPGDANMVVDIFGGRAPYTTTIAIDGGTAVPAREATVTLPPSGNRAVQIVVTDANTGNDQLKKTLDIAVTRLATTPTTVLLPGQPTPGGAVPDATIDPISYAPGQALLIKHQDASEVEVVLDPPAAGVTSWTAGTQSGTGESFKVKIGQGETIVVTAKRDAQPDKFIAYWHFDRPPENPPTLAVDYAANPANARTSPALDGLPAGEWVSDQLFAPTIGPRLKTLPAQVVNVIGHASYEGDDLKADYNMRLSQRRAEGIETQLKPYLAPGMSLNVTWRGFADAKSSTLGLARNLWWKVDVLPTVGAPSESTGTLARGTATAPGTTPPVAQAIPIPDPPTAAPPPPPDWFREAHVTVRILRDQLIALELGAKIDLQTAAESQLPAAPGGQAKTLPVRAPAGTNTYDGRTDLRVVWQKDPGTGTITTRMFIGADPNDKDGLLMLGRRPDEPTPGDNEPPDFWTSYTGFVASLLPLISAAVPDVPNNGLLTDILDTAAVTALPIALAVASSNNEIALRVERVVLYGIEAMVEDREDGARVVVLFDVETALSGAIPSEADWLLKVPRNNPLSVRYKAVGVRVGTDPNEPKDNGVVPRFHPVFDASRGYTIDASRPGQIQLRKGLDSILRILGARIARTNPLSFEIDIGSAVELGPVTISRIRVRMPFDPPYIPELTALGVSVDVPGAVRGKGELEISANGLGGSIDLTLTPIGLRISASIDIEKVAKATDPSQLLTSVFIGLGIEFPAPIPLWTSGIGIYGFLGAFAMNRRRNQNGTDIPAILEWAKKDPADRGSWVAEAGHWGFGLGAVLGTLDGGFLFNLRGAFILELPGPNLLLTMKARLLAPRPSTLPPQFEPPAIEAVAIIDIDLEAGTLSIGLLVNYEIKYLVKLNVPVEAFFDTNHPEDWHVWAGKYQPDNQRISAKVLSAFDGSGYLMLQGDKLAIGGFPETKGFGVAAGIDVHFVWGSTDAGLYARVGGGFDALLGFDPLRLDAKLRLDGELRLFIVSIGAHADLTLSVAKSGDDVSARLDGEVCGKVEFFFFDVEGCVDFGLGAGTLPGWTAPELIADFAVMSRSPALALGTAIGRPVDAKVKPEAAPIDSIPVLTLRAPAAQPFPQIFNRDIGGPGGGSADGYSIVSGRRVRYLLKSVELVIEGNEAATPFTGEFTAADTPSVWWLRNSPSDTAPTASVQLALLTWTPTPAPKAIEYGIKLTEQIAHRWGEACGTAAPPTAILWTFLRHPTGPSPAGWNLWDGIAWPDPKGTVRSAPPNITLLIDEAWRASIPSPGGVEPAAIEIRAMACPKFAAKKKTPFLPVYGKADELLQARLEIESKAALAVANTFGAGAAGVKVGGNEAKTAAAATRIANIGLRPKLSCYGRMLGSPIFDQGPGSGFGTKSEPQSALDKLLGIGTPNTSEPKPASSLWNAVRIHIGPSRNVRLFLLVRADVLRLDRLAIVAIDADGEIIAKADPAPLPTADLPGEWTDFGGPWQRPMAFVQGFDTVPGYIKVLATFDTLDTADRIEIGIIPKQDDALNGRMAGRHFYVGAIEALRLGEIARAAWDESQIKQDAAVVASALDEGSHKHALLIKDTPYIVRTTWTVQEEGGTEQPLQTQELRFRTDNVPPNSLRPWVVASHPAEGEAHVFGGEKVSIVFATDDIARLWKGYHRSLRMKLRAASFRQPDATDKPYPWPIDGPLENKPGSLVSPWEQAITEAKDGGLLGCVGALGEATRNVELTIPVPLDSFTDYTMVIEETDDDDAAKDPRVVLSIGFSTSGWHTAADFAQAFSGAAIRHAHLPDPAKLADFVTGNNGRMAEGAAFDDMCMKAGLGALPPQPGAAVTVYWSSSPGQPPQPTAILIEAVEAIWRSRPIPRPFFDADSQTSRMVMTPVTWLCPAELVPAIDSAPAPQPSGTGLIQATTWAAGGRRGLFLLKPGARGKPILLGLRHIDLAMGPADGGTNPCPVDPATPPPADGPPVAWLRMFGATLRAAPWEDDEA